MCDSSHTSESLRAVISCGSWSLLPYGACLSILPALSGHHNEARAQYVPSDLRCSGFDSLCNFPLVAYRICQYLMTYLQEYSSRRIIAVTWWRSSCIQPEAKFWTSGELPRCRLESGAHMYRAVERAVFSRPPPWRPGWYWVTRQRYVTVNSRGTPQSPRGVCLHVCYSSLSKPNDWIGSGCDDQSSGKWHRVVW
jgi:hypothetical protein